MKKEITIDSLRKIVNESVTNVLKEYVEPFVPGLEKDGKLGKAQYDASLRVRGTAGKNDSDWTAHLRRNGDPDYYSKDKLSSILLGLKSSDSSRRNDSAHKLADILSKNEEMAQKVYIALRDDAFKHMRDYAKWNTEN